MSTGNRRRSFAVYLALFLAMSETICSSAPRRSLTIICACMTWAGGFFCSSHHVAFTNVVLQVSQPKEIAERSSIVTMPFLAYNGPPHTLHFRALP